MYITYYRTGICPLSTFNDICLKNILSYAILWTSRCCNWNYTCNYGTEQAESYDTWLPFWYFFSKNTSLHPHQLPLFQGEKNQAEWLHIKEITDKNRICVNQITISWERKKTHSSSTLLTLLQPCNSIQPLL